MTSDFANLLSPYTLAGRTLRNRSVLPATVTNYAQKNRITEAYKNFLIERAKGGVAMLVTEVIAVDPNAIAQPAIVTGFDQANDADFKDLADRVHAAGGQLVVNSLPEEFTIGFVEAHDVSLVALDGRVACARNRTTAIDRATEFREPVATEMVVGLEGHAERIHLLVTSPALGLANNREPLPKRFVFVIWYLSININRHVHHDTGQQLFTNPLAAPDRIVVEVSAVGD